MTSLGISISALAWQPADDIQVATLLSNMDVHAVDLVPGKYFDIEAFTSADTGLVKKFWADHGIEIVGMQSLLFGLGDPSIFDADGCDVIATRMERLCILAEQLGSKVLTFGSPKSRVFAHRNRFASLDQAHSLFTLLDEMASKHGVVICLEPNPVDYGCEFLTSTGEADAYISQLGLANIALQLDTGAALMNGESADAVEIKAAVGHLHVSSPGLGGVPSDQPGLQEKAQDLLAHWGKVGSTSGHATIEMLNPNPEEPLLAIVRAVDFLKTNLS